MEHRKVTEIVWREDLYPRINPDPATIQQYAENLDVLPPIEVNQHNELIDGYHRWTAHRKMEAENIPVIVTPTANEAEFLELAIKRNATHGMQLSSGDKKRMARQIYGRNGYDKDALADLLSVSRRSVQNWVSDIDKANREERDRKIFDMWLACYTREDIANEIDLTYGGQLAEKIKQLSVLENFPKQTKLSAEFGEPDWPVPLYNVWHFGKLTNEVHHFGNSEKQILDRLLYLYTKPFDIVVDPFAGGGSTIDVCKRRLRRYFISDRKPIVERENEIRTLDIVNDLPPLYNRWSEVTLTYLDPPYWRQAAGKYSDDAEDLANMSLADFTRNMVDIVNRIAAKQSRGYIAMLMQPTQWNAENREFTDHITDIVGGVNLKLENRISCPYSTEQCNAQMVNWAKENKKLLVISRELIVWRLE